MNIKNSFWATFRVVAFFRGLSSLLAQLPRASYVSGLRRGGCDVLWCG